MKMSMKMKISMFVLMLFSSTLLHAMTKEWVVTKVNYDDTKKIYMIDFKNQAGIYKAEEKLLPCLRESLAEQKAVKIDFNPMGLKLKSCVKAATR